MLIFFCQDRQAWNFFEHTGNKRFIGPPKKDPSLFSDWDCGIIGQWCGNDDRKCYATPHMICDLNGNGIQWSQLRSSMVVKIRSMHSHWPGYEYLYASKNGRYFVIIIGILH